MILKACLLASGLLACFCFAMSVGRVDGLLRKLPREESGAAPRYHFSLYVPDAQNDYIDEIVSGAERAAEGLGAALSVHSIGSDGEGLGLASRIGAEGIVVCPDIDGVKQELLELSAQKIPLVLANHNIPSEQPWPFVGTNNFAFGKKIGVLLASEDRRPAILAIVYSDKNPALYADRELVEMGIRDSARGGAALSVQAFKTDLNPSQAEQVVYKLVKSGVGADTIMFTDAEDTLAGTQALVDLNLVGRMRIIGFGSAPAILGYVKKGVVLATLAVHPDMIGYQALRSLAELRESGYTSSAVDTGIDVVTSGNIAKYYDRKGQP